MLIKIRKPHGLGSIMYEGVTHFDYSRYASNYLVAISEEGDDYTQQCLSPDKFNNYPLTEDQVDSISTTPEPPDKIYLFLKMKNGETKQVLAYGNVFVLNDEGKTVEKF